jgi:hypothetical protein
MEDYNIISSIPSGEKNAEQNILNIGKMRENGAKFSANFPRKYGIICLLCQILVILDGWNSKKSNCLWQKGELYTRHGQPRCCKTHTLNKVSCIGNNRHTTLYAALCSAAWQTRA